MDLTVLFSVLILGGLGAAFGIILGVASKKLAVEKDEREEAVRELLPGANCGGCGFPGCDGMAAAIVEGKAEISACAPLSKDNAKRIGEVMGVDVGDIKPKVARIMCLGSNGHVKDKFVYDGAMDCRAAYATASGFKACRFACLGLGTCAKVCKFGAIEMGMDGIAFIDEEKCTGCGRCVEQCPQMAIAVLHRDIDVYAGCTNMDKGKAVTVNCSAGCIGCGICAKSCPFDAIVMENNLPVIDPDKCRSCWTCVEKCPRKCMLTTKPDKRAEIEEEKCIGCTLCRKACPFGAIEGELKEPHKVLEDKCRGCGLCTEACKKDAVHLVNKETGVRVDVVIKSEMQPKAAEEPPKAEAEAAQDVLSTEETAETPETTEEIIVETIVVEAVVEEAEATAENAEEVIAETEVVGESAAAEIVTEEAATGPEVVETVAETIVAEVLTEEPEAVENVEIAPAEPAASAEDVADAPQKPAPKKPAAKKPAAKKPAAKKPAAKKPAAEQPEE